MLFVYVPPPFTPPVGGATGDWRILKREPLELLADFKARGRSEDWGRRGGFMFADLVNGILFYKGCFMYQLGLGTL